MKIDFSNYANRATEIFNSNYPNSVKLDLICRISSNLLECTSVSLLLYSSIKDSLICKGFYLNLDYCIFLSEVDNQKRTVLKYLPILEYLNTVFSDNPNIGSFSGFCNSIFYEEYFTEHEFNEIQSSFEKLKQFYEIYKKSFKKDTYMIDDSSISGGYYQELINQPSLSYIRIVPKTFDLQERPVDKKKWSNILGSEFDMHLDNNGYYIGIPIIASDRCLGIMRITDSSRQNHKIYKTEDSFLILEKYKEVIIFISKLISSHIDTMNYLHGYKSLAASNFFDIYNLNYECNLLAENINCHGVYVRLDSNNNDTPEIKGFSNNIQPYYDFLLTFEDKRKPNLNGFSKPILELFRSEKKIAAINLSTKLGSEKIIRYYYEHNNIKKEEKTIKNLDHNESIDYNKKLTELKIHELVVVPLSNNNYIIFSNTKNRSFNLPDIEMIILASRRVDLEITHHLDKERIKENEKQNSLISSTRVVVHQIGSLVSAASNHIDNLVKGRLFPKSKSIEEGLTVSEFELIRKKANELGFIMNQAKRQLVRSRRILELDEKPINPNLTTIQDFNKYVLNKCKDYEAYAQSEKGIHIWLNSKSDNIRNFFTDSELMDEVMYNLLDNAIKYSYNSFEMDYQGINFDPATFNSDGNILVTVINTFEKVEVSVKNWGVKIPVSERKTILEKFKRGSNSKNIVGSGIGLYLVDKIIKSLNGTIEIESAKNYTIFKLTLKK